MKSRGGHRDVIALACAAAAVGASFEGCFGFSDLQGGQIPDASLDSPVPDAAGDTLAPVDATPPSDAAATGSFCASLFDATFCDDFDQPDAASLAKWQPRNVSAGASLAVQASGLSEPNSLVGAVLQDDSGPGTPAASVSYIVPGTVHFVRFQYDLFVEKYDKTTGSSAYVNPFDMRVGLTDTELRLYLDGNGFGLAAAITTSDGGTSYPLLGPKMILTTGVWHHMEIDTDFSRSPAAVTFLFDSSVIVTDAGVAGAVFGPGAVTVEGPIQYARTPTSGWNIHIDNVAVFSE